MEEVTISSCDGFFDALRQFSEVVVVVSAVLYNIRSFSPDIIVPGFETRH